MPAGELSRRPGPASSVTVSESTSAPPREQREVPARSRPPCPSAAAPMIRLSPWSLESRAARATDLHIQPPRVLVTSHARATRRAPMAARGATGDTGGPQNFVQSSWVSTGWGGGGVGGGGSGAGGAGG